MSESNIERNEKINQKTSTFTCDSCGAWCVFDPEHQALKCEFCGSLFDIQTDKDFVAKELSLLAVDEQEISNDWGNDARVFRCKNCGGETVLEGGNVAVRCVFCSSPQVVQLDELPGIKPQSVLPFAITAKKARNMFKSWVSKRFWAPSNLKKEHTIAKNLKGLYVPYWTYDADTSSSYSGTAGNYYYVPETYSVVVNGKSQVKTRQLQKVRWFPVAGQLSKEYDDVLQNDGYYMNENIMKNIEPFDLSILCKYDPKFLAGFATEKYHHGVLKQWDNAKDFIESDVRNRVNSDILAKADVVGNVNIDTQYQNLTYKHTLLPVWLSMYNYRGKVFNFCINGQTGEVQGKSPVSTGKVLIAILIALVAVFFIVKWVMT